MFLFFSFSLSFPFSFILLHSYSIYKGITKKKYLYICLNIEIFKTQISPISQRFYFQYEWTKTLIWLKSTLKVHYTMQMTFYSVVEDIMEKASNRLGHISSPSCISWILKKKPIEVKSSIKHYALRVGVLTESYFL